MSAEGNPEERLAQCSDVRLFDDVASIVSISARDLQELKLAPLRLIIPNFLPEGCGVYGGKRKGGKSRFWLHAATALASGTIFLGHFETAVGDVLYFDLENGPRRVQWRMKEIFGDGAAPERLTLRFSAPFVGNGLEDEIRKWADGCSNPSLVVIDILARVRPPQDRRNGPAPTYASDYTIIRALTALAQELRVAIAVITHVTKSPATDPFDEIGGTMGLTGAADWMAVQRRETGGMDACVHMLGREIEERQIALAREPQVGWRYVGEGADLRLQATRRDIVDFLRREGDATPKGIAESLGLRDDLVRQTLGRMYDDEQVGVAKGGRYRAL